MQLVKSGWISGESAPFTSEPVEVVGCREVAVQISSAVVDTGVLVQESIDGVAFETLGEMHIQSGDVSDGAEISVFLTQGGRFVRLHLANDGGGTPTVSAVLR